MKNVKNEIRNLERRTKAMMEVTKLTVRVQVEQLANAEKLRKAAKAVVDSIDKPACGVSVRIAVSARELYSLRELLKRLNAFHTPTRMPAAVKALLKTTKGNP